MAKPGEKNYFEDYSAFLKARESWIKEMKDSTSRFVPIAERQDHSSLSDESFKKLEQGKYMTDWKGIGISKNPIDLGILAAILWDVKPRTVVELGVLRGGSVVWLADHVKMFGLNCNVIGLDIDYSFLHENAKNRKDVTFLTGDINAIETILTPAMLKELPHPWIIIEDAHVSLKHVLSYFEQYMEPGDYFVVEDGHPSTCVDTFDVIEKNDNRWGTSKLAEIRRILTEKSNLKIDSLYNDRFGYNMAFNVNGYIRKV